MNRGNRRTVLKSEFTCTTQSLNKWATTDDDRGRRPRYSSADWASHIRRPRATSALQQRGLGEPHSHAQLPLEERQHRAVMSASTWRRTTSSARASPIAATSCAFHAAEPCVPSMRADGYGQELVEQSTKLVPALDHADQVEHISGSSRLKAAKLSALVEVPAPP
jgi:hypothetical protein